MALSKQDRISISKEIIEIPSRVKKAEETKNLVLSSKTALIAQDNVNKNLIANLDSLINPYQVELGAKNGKGYTTLLESMYKDAAERVKGNVFFYSNPEISTPSVPDGVWKNFAPVMTGYGIGKNYVEVLPDSPYGEKNSKQVFDTFFNLMSSYPSIQRVTGLKCNAGAPPSVDTFVNIPEMHQAMDDAVTAMSAYLSACNLQINAIQQLITLDPQNASAAQTELISVNTVKAAVETWLAYNDFNINHGTATCAAFNSKDASTLSPTKGYSVQLNALNNALNLRASEMISRNDFIVNKLGDVTQTSKGEISGSGLYFSRAQIINMRLHLISGSLTNLNNVDRSSNTLDENIKSSKSASNVYSSVMSATTLKTTANGSIYIHLDDPSLFSVGDMVYIASDTQDELVLFVKSKDGSRLTVDKEVGTNFLKEENSRVYKVL